MLLYAHLSGKAVVEFLEVFSCIPRFYSVKLAIGYHLRTKSAAQNFHDTVSIPHQNCKGNKKELHFLFIFTLLESGWFNFHFLWKLHKICAGDYEYIDVINHNSENPERVIIDLDFRSHFEIARAVESYDKILKSLPVVYVGSLPKLKQLLQVMVEAARSSLKQNSMPLPPWRSLAYLQKKWHSPYQRHFYHTEQSDVDNNFSDHKQCVGHLKRLQSSLQSEVETERLLKPINVDTCQRPNFESRRHSLLMA